MAALRFPSLEWFQALNDVVRHEDVFRKRGAGAADTRMGIKVGDDIYVVTFESYTVAGVEKIGEDRLPEIDFYLEQSPDEWKTMLQNIKEHGRAEGLLTLNSLDAMSETGFAQSRAPYLDGDARDAFYRFNQTLQDYFDTSAHLETVF